MSGPRAPDRHRFPIHRRTGLASARPLPLVLRYARRAPALGPLRRPGGHAAGEQVQRHDLRRRPQPHRVRARHVEPCPGAPNGRRETLATHFEGMEPTARTMSASNPAGRSTSPIPGTAACPSMASNDRDMGSRVCTVFRRAAGRPSSSSTATFSSSPTGSASARRRSASS